MASTEEQKKAILPFLQVSVRASSIRVAPRESLLSLPHPDHLPPSLQRADEVNKVDPKVAYYCRMYAIEQVMSPVMLFLHSVVTPVLEARCEACVSC